MTDLSGDLFAGFYVATSTVYTGRRNLFSMEPGKERHIGTLVNSYRTELQRFDEDCDRIVRGLAMLDAQPQMLAALERLERATVEISRTPLSRGQDIADALVEMRAAIAIPELRVAK